MTVKEDFLIENRLEIMEKAKYQWFYSGDVEISEKRIDASINEIFDYLSQNDVYVNIYDIDFLEIIMKDLNESIQNFIFPLEDYEFMSNFKGSIRHQPNKERDRLLEFVEIIPFEKFRIFLELNTNINNEGGRPPYDKVLMFKINFLKAYYDLSDEKTARKIKSDDAYQCFLGYPEKYPCKSTIWNSRKEIENMHIIKDIWNVFKDYAVKIADANGKFVSQDASFYTQDKGQKRKNYPRGEFAKTRRSRDGEFVKKNNKTYFGLKIHTKQDKETQLVLDFQLTPANVHDSKVELCKSYEIDFKDKGYYEKKYKQFNGGMTKARRNNPLVIWEIRRNQRIASNRAPVERTYAFLNRINNSHTKITTIKGNEIIITILMILFNAEQLITLEKQKNKNKNIENACEENENNLNMTANAFKFFNNSIIYYNNPSLINFLTTRYPNQHTIKAQKAQINIKDSKNTPSISKSEYKRNKNKKLKKMRNKQNKKLNTAYKHTLNSINEFNLITIKT